MTTGGEHTWRLTVRFARAELVHQAFGALKARTAAAIASDALRTHCVVRRDGEWIRVYAESLDGLRRAQGEISRVVAMEHVQAEELAERSSGGDKWEQVDLSSISELGASTIRVHSGSGPWGAETEPERVQVHFEVGSRHAAATFARQLAREGYDVHSAESFVFVFADDRESAAALAPTLTRLAPPGARLFLEGEGNTFLL